MHLRGKRRVSMDNNSQRINHMIVIELTNCILHIDSVNV